MSEYRPNPQQNQPTQQFQPQFPPGGLPPMSPAIQPPKKRRWVPWAAGVGAFIVGVGVGGAGGGTDTTASSSPQPTTTVTAPAQPGQKVTVPGPTKTVPGPVRTVTAPPPAPAGVMADDGVYLVGTDIKPGTYRNGPEGDCYWARLRNTNGDLDSIIANNNGGNQVVTIKRTDKAFETTNCGTWRKVG